jgi:lysozyme
MTNYSEELLNLIRASEGLKLTAYMCPAGVPTIGYGHTKGVTKAQVDAKRTITKAQADALLAEDLARVEQSILKSITVPVSVRQLDALISFVFNVGGGNLASSTLLKKLNAGDYAGAANEFPKWNKATVKGKKVVLPGLTARRSAERTLFLGESGAMPQEVSSGEPKSLASSKTIAGGVIAGAGVAGSIGVQQIIDALAAAQGPLTEMAATMEAARYALAFVTLAGSALTIYARIADRKAGVK